MAQVQYQHLAAGRQLQNAQLAPFRVPGASSHPPQGQEDRSASTSSSSRCWHNSTSSSDMSELHLPMSNESAMSNQSRAVNGNRAFLKNANEPRTVEGRRRQEVLEHILTASEESSVASSANNLHAKLVKRDGAQGSHRITPQAAEQELASLLHQHAANTANANPVDIVLVADQGASASHSHGGSGKALVMPAPVPPSAGTQQLHPQVSGPYEPAQAATHDLESQQPSQPDDTVAPNDHVCTEPADVFEEMPFTQLPHALANMPMMLGSLRLPPLWIQVPEGLPTPGSTRQAAASTGAAAEQETRHPEPASKGHVALMDPTDRSPLTHPDDLTCGQCGIPNEREADDAGPAAMYVPDKGAWGLNLEQLADRQSEVHEPLRESSEQQRDQGALAASQTAEVTDAEQQPLLPAPYVLGDEQQVANEASLAQQPAHNDEQQPLLQTGGLKSDFDLSWPISYEPTPSGSPPSQLQELPEPAHSLPGPPNHAVEGMPEEDTAPIRIAEGEGMAGAVVNQLYEHEKPSSGAAGGLSAAASGVPSMKEALGDMSPTEPSVKPSVQRQLWRFPAEGQLSIGLAVAHPSTPRDYSVSSGKSGRGDTPPLQPVASAPPTPAAAPAPEFVQPDMMQSTTPAYNDSCMDAAESMHAITLTRLPRSEQVLQSAQIEDSWLQCRQEGPMGACMAAQPQLVQQSANKNQPVAPLHEPGGLLSRQPSNAIHPGDGHQSTSYDGSSSCGSSMDLPQADVDSTGPSAEFLPQDNFSRRSVI